MYKDYSDGSCLMLMLLKLGFGTKVSSGNNKSNDKSELETLSIIESVLILLEKIIYILWNKPFYCLIASIKLTSSLLFSR